MNRGKYPLSLWIGGLMVLMLILLALFGPYLAPYDITYQENVRTEIIDGKEVLIKTPMPPSSAHWLGTDKWGYDILTLLLHGARYTMLVTLLIAFLRILIGTLFGLYLGMAERRQGWWLGVENAWSHIPIVLPVYFLLLGINFNSELSVSELIGLFVVIVTILGTPSVVSSIRQKTEQVKEMPFVLAAVSLGAGRNRLVLHHILPQLREEIMLVFVMEVIAVMTLMGQLGLFNLFVGGTIMQFDPMLYHSVTHEWAGLIGQARNFIFSNSLWILYAPLGAFMLAIIAFSLLAKGLRDRSKQRYQRVPYL
ncbi:ABC transporter permease [Brevibacillus humidisoli]|uniref:ABC transporter permease n=1 Tax=Brevibacillus humidisoli TaxID=2895522 RepID=UPI001E655053|nr:ABC transporter permease [Brevibacillus humidisoli]UFJ39111.1 ABC transporter permease [Brevibacillus humidisoli]